jgi:hypothetical protein
MESTTRRSFYSAAIAGLGAIMTAALAAPAAAYLLFRPKSQKQSDFVPAADLSQLTIGKPEGWCFTAHASTDGAC